MTNDGIFQITRFGPLKAFPIFKEVYCNCL